jgi:hypothetical protein
MQKSFKDWWDDEYFSTRRFYSQYQELHRLGADLDFVDRLAGMLRYYDTLTSLRVRAKRRRGRLKNDSSLFREKVLIKFAVLQGMRHGTVSSTKIDEIAEGILEEAKGLKFPTAIPIKAGDKGAIKELVQIGASTLEDKWPPIMLEYILTAMNASGGAPSDKWGTLTLVALTEHLRDRTGRPHHSLAIRTLKALRGEQLGTKDRETDDAKSRVSYFKKHNKDWNNLIKSLET